MTPDEVLSLWQWAKRMYVETGSQEYQTVMALCWNYANDTVINVGWTMQRDVWQSILDKMQ